MAKLPGGQAFDEIDPIVRIEAFDLRDNESDKKMTTSKHSIAINSFESAWKNLRNIKSKPKALILSFEVASKFVFIA